ncbi:hypothetical protein ACHAXR_009840, partial [Thalassiosira sp. AJA248-18]
MVSSRSTVIIAGALFVSPLAAAAFRTPTSSRINPALFLSSSSSTSNGAPALIRLNASLLSDSLDADRQQQETATDIISRAVENSHVSVNGANMVTDLVNGVDLDFEKEKLQKQLQQEPQQRKKQQQQSSHLERHINKSRQNNKAMADPEFLRKRTQTLLRKTQDKGGNSSDGTTLKVDKRTFDWLIDAWSYSGEHDAADHALSLLHRMEELRDTTIDHPSISPDVKSYTKVINAIARSGREDAGEQAEEILNRMIHESADDIGGGGVVLRPNTFTYTYVIDAYARSQSPKAPHAAQRLVEHMEQLRLEGDPEVRPTTRAWNSVIAAWAQWKG